MLPATPEYTENCLRALKYAERENSKPENIGQDEVFAMMDANEDFDLIYSHFIIELDRAEIRRDEYTIRKCRGALSLCMRLRHSEVYSLKIESPV